MQENDSVESKIKIKTESSIKRTHEEYITPRGLVSATGGLGLRYQIDEEEQKRIEEENEKYLPFSKRARTYEENFQYVEQVRQAHLEKITNLRIKESNSNESIIKNEPSEIDSNEIVYYNSYNFMNHKYNENLPIIKYQTEIVNCLNDNNIVIIQGNTGCGKTTQVPQFIIDDAARHTRPCKIIITQPRRLAAKSISKRVCEERNWEWGSVCGFKVSMENKFSADTRIFYVTTGYLQEMIVANHDELKSYSHIILDEVHDRDLDTDLIILLVKILLIQEYKGKIVLMSATLDPALFVEYFLPVSQKSQVPIIKCEMNVFDVKILYLDDLESRVNYEVF